MVAVLLVLAFAATLWGVMGAAGLFEDRSYFRNAVILGFFLRLALQIITRNVPFFAHGAGGDAVAYELYANQIVGTWERGGIHYVTQEEIPWLGPATLPSNLFAFILFITTEESAKFACTALIALAAGLTVVNIYTLAIEFGGTQRSAAMFATIFYFQPSFLFYTSDMYKDGLVLCLTVGALASALRLSSRFSARHLVLGLVSLWGLWYVRYYLLFVTTAPLLVGLAGFGKKSSSFRSLLTAIVLAAALLLFASLTDVLQTVSSRAAETFDRGTGAYLVDNATYGSGVTFDDGGVPYRALPQKLAYTLFSPFPWSGGSFGLQLGKFDAFIWYFAIYRAVKGARTVDRRLLLMLATFIVPCTLMYAMSMSNIGLIVRQRLVIVVAVIVLAALYDPQRARMPDRNASTPARLAA